VVSPTLKKHAIRSHQHLAGRRSYRFGFGYKFGAVLVAIGLGTTVLLVTEFSGRKPLTAEEETFLERYEIIRAKLAHDELSGARNESSLLTQFSRSPIATAARAIAEGETLAQARLGFVALSEQAILIARNRNGYYVMYCPLVGCPQNCENCPMSRFGDWLQITPAAENPFVGADQARCGIVRQ
jgi:hypothetical protein